jgi:hypothetical protein
MGSSPAESVSWGNGATPLRRTLRRPQCRDSGPEGLFFLYLDIGDWSNNLAQDFKKRCE